MNHVVSHVFVAVDVNMSVNVLDRVDPLVVRIAVLLPQMQSGVELG
jgi:hypothetical protein